MDKIFRIFLLKLAKKNTFFYTSLAAISSLVNIDEPVQILFYDL